MKMIVSETMTTKSIIIKVMTMITAKQEERERKRGRQKVYVKTMTLPFYYSTTMHYITGHQTGPASQKKKKKKFQIFVYLILFY